MMKKLVWFLIIITVTSVFSSCDKTEPEGKEPGEKPRVVVASKIDTEGTLLGNMILLMLRKNGFVAVDNLSFGPTDVVRRAIINGEFDIYPEYTGNGAFFFDQAESAVWKNPEEGYRTVKDLDYRANRLVWLTPAPANNTWAVCVRKDVAEEHGLVTLEDLAAYIHEGGYFKLAGSEEFAGRPDALPAFEAAYGFKLSEDQLLILSGGNTAQTEQAAARETEGVNAAMAYGTDGQLSALGLVVLEDSLNIQPVYEPTPVVREDILKAHPEIESILKPVFESLDLVTLQTLNASISVEGRNAAEVAEEYLKAKGFL